MSDHENRNPLSRLARTGGGFFLAIIVFVGIVLGGIIPIDVPFFSEGFDIIASMFIYPMALVIIFCFLWWLPITS